MSGRVEVVPDGDLLFRAVHKKYVREDGSVSASAFMTGGRCEVTKEEFVSVDWSKYSGPLDCRMRRKAPEENLVFELKVIEVRALDAVHSVEHRPSERNHAHAGVFAKAVLYNTEFRSALLSIATRVDLDCCGSV